MTHTIYSGRYDPLPDLLVHGAWQERVIKYQSLRSIREENQGWTTTRGTMPSRQQPLQSDFAMILDGICGKGATVVCSQKGDGGVSKDDFSMGMVSLPIFNIGMMAGKSNQDYIERRNKRKVTPVARTATE